MRPSALGFWLCARVRASALWWISKALPKNLNFAKNHELQKDFKPGQWHDHIYINKNRERQGGRWMEEGKRRGNKICKGVKAETRLDRVGTGAERKYQIEEEWAGCFYAYQTLKYILQIYNN